MLTEQDLFTEEQIKENNLNKLKVKVAEWPNLVKAIEEDSLIEYIQDRFQGNVEYTQVLISDLFKDESVIEDFWSWGHNSRWALLSGIDKEVLVNELISWLEEETIND